jgi:hypothetical protein
LIAFEASAIFREKARTPARTVPRATCIVVGFLGGFYAFIARMTIQAFGDATVVGVVANDLAVESFVAMDQYVGGDRLRDSARVGSHRTGGRL